MLKLYREAAVRFSVVLAVLLAFVVGCITQRASTAEGPNAATGREHFDNLTAKELAEAFEPRVGALVNALPEVRFELTDKERLARGTPTSRYRPRGNRPRAFQRKTSTPSSGSSSKA